MNKKTTRTEDKRLAVARLAITNALETPYIADSLARFGYDQARLQEGKGLLETAETAYADHKKEYGDQYAATDFLASAREEARAMYMQHLKLARMALKNSPAFWEPLQMQGERNPRPSY